MGMKKIESALKNIRELRKSVGNNPAMKKQLDDMEKDLLFQAYEEEEDDDDNEKAEKQTEDSQTSTGMDTEHLSDNQNQSDNSIEDDNVNKSVMLVRHQEDTSDKEAENWHKDDNEDIEIPIDSDKAKEVHSNYQDLVTEKNGTANPDNTEAMVKADNSESDEDAALDALFGSLDDDENTDDTDSEDNEGSSDETVDSDNDDVPADDNKEAEMKNDAESEEETEDDNTDITQGFTDYGRNEKEPEETTKNTDTLNAIQSLDNATSLKSEAEEKALDECMEKPITDFLFSRNVVKLKGDATDSHDAIDDSMVVTVFPLQPKTNDGNAKIFCVIEYDGEFYYGSSYDNKNGSSMLVLGVGEYSILVSGRFIGDKFSVRIFENGILGADGCRAEITENSTPTIAKERVGLGHLKLKYEAAKNTIGTVEAFPVSTTKNQTVWFIIRVASDFVDYTLLNNNVVYINTIEGDMVLDLTHKGGVISIALIDKDS